MSIASTRTSRSGKRRVPRAAPTTDLLPDPHQNTDSGKLYAYGYIDWPEKAIWTLGMGVDRTDVPERRQTEPTPKLGVEYRATDWLTLRGAAFRTVKSNIVAQQTIEPTSVAGFNQVFDDFNGTKADQAAIGADLRLRPDLWFGVEGVYRDISAPRLDDGSDDSDFITQDASETAASGYVYWTATDRLAVTFELHGSRFRHDEDDAAGGPQDVDSILAPFSLRYFHPSGFFAVGGVQYVWQSVTESDGPGSSTTAPPIPGSWTPRSAIACRIVAVSSASSSTICSTRRFIGRTIAFAAPSSRTAASFPSGRP